MGEELIPFVSKEKAQKFLNDHFGKKVLKFEEIKESMLY
jgi:nitrous oxide reductase accessory protein NosL